MNQAIDVKVATLRKRKNLRPLTKMINTEMKQILNETRNEKSFCWAWITMIKQRRVITCVKNNFNRLYGLRILAYRFLKQIKRTQRRFLERVKDFSVSERK